MSIWDQCQYLNICAPTPPLTQQQSTDNSQLITVNVGLREG